MKWVLFQFYDMGFVVIHMEGSMISALYHILGELIRGILVFMFYVLKC